MCAGTVYRKVATAEDQEHLSNSAQEGRTLADSKEPCKRGKGRESATFLKVHLEGGGVNRCTVNLMTNDAKLKTNCNTLSVTKKCSQILGYRL